MRRLVLTVAAAVAGLVALPASASALSANPTCKRGGPGGPLTTCSGWHTTPINVTWQWSSDATDADCPMVTLTRDGTTRPSCRVSNPSGALTVEVQISIDQTAPVVTSATPSRAADPSGWFRAPVDVQFSGADGTSGVDSCTTASYAGPDNPAVSISGTCRDRAGNVSAPSAFSLRYDATAPSLVPPSAAAGDGVVTVRWVVPADAASVELVRATDGGAEELLYRGAGTELTDRGVRNGTRYRYTLRAADEAGNVASAAVEALPDRRLLEPARNARVGGPPLLRWTKVRGARYYNVQIYRDGRKILSRWPRKARYQLHERWSYRGRRYRLRPGRYRWYVWPGKGKPSDRRYGRLVGRGTFTVSA